MKRLLKFLVLPITVGVLVLATAITAFAHPPDSDGPGPPGLGTTPHEVSCERQGNTLSRIHDQLGETALPPSFDAQVTMYVGAACDIVHLTFELEHHIIS